MTNRETRAIAADLGTSIRRFLEEMTSTSARKGPIAIGWDLNHVAAPIIAPANR
jgi:hypothetical protein